MVQYAIIINAAAQYAGSSQHECRRYKFRFGPTAHLFAPLEAPRLASISWKAIQDFLAYLEAYEDAISAQPSLKPIFWRSCFPASFLRSLMRARILGADVTAVTQLTDEKIRSKLETFAAGTSTVSAEETLADVKKNVRLDSSEPGARLHFMMMCASYLELCDKVGWKIVEKAPKAAIKCGIIPLRPGLGERRRLLTREHAARS